MQDLMLGKMQNRSCPRRCYPRCRGVTLRRGVTQCEDLPNEWNYQMWGFAQGEELPNMRIYLRRGISKYDDSTKERNYPMWGFTQEELPSVRIYPRRGVTSWGEFTHCENIPKGRSYPVWIMQGGTIAVHSVKQQPSQSVSGAGLPTEWSQAQDDQLNDHRCRMTNWMIRGTGWSTEWSQVQDEWSEVQDDQLNDHRYRMTNWMITGTGLPTEWSEV